MSKICQTTKTGHRSIIRIVIYPRQISARLTIVRDVTPVTIAVLAQGKAAIIAVLMDRQTTKRYPSECSIRDGPKRIIKHLPRLDVVPPHRTGVNDGRASEGGFDCIEPRLKVVNQVCRALRRFVIVRRSVAIVPEKDLFLIFNVQGRRQFSRAKP